MNLFRRLLDYFHLGKVGFPELVIAMYPILIGYIYGFFYVGLLAIALVDVYVLSKQHVKFINNRAFYLISGYVILHEFVLWFILGFEPMYMLYATIQLSFIIVSIAIISSSINYEKLINSFYWVAVFCIGGLIYQYMIIAAGGTVSPIRLPFFSPLEAGSRFDEIVIRPTSFFFEPSQFATYLIIPLFIALKEKKLLLSTFITIMMFLSTSTNGIFFSLGLVFVYAISSKGVKLWYKLLMIVVGVGLVYFLVNSEFFEQGITKIENTDITENSRTANGIKYVKSLSPSTLILGINDANASDYYAHHTSLFSGASLEVRDGDVYITTFWLVLIKYGVIGLLLYLNMYYYFFKKDKSLFPYMAIIVVSLFTQSLFFDIVQIVFLVSYTRYNTNIGRINNRMNNNKQFA